MASNVGRYANAATDLSDAASVHKFLLKDFRADQIATWVDQLRTALDATAVARDAPHADRDLASSSAASTVATRRAALEARRRRLVSAARNLITELRRILEALDPVKRHLLPLAWPEPVPGESPQVRAFKAVAERIQDAAFVSTHLGVPLSLAALDLATLSRSLEQTNALVGTLTKWSRFEVPPKKAAKPSKGTRTTAHARDAELATFLAIVSHAKLKPKQLAAIECLARNSFAVTTKSRSDVAWAAEKIRGWEKTLERTKPGVEHLLFWANYSPEMDETAVVPAPGE